MLLLLLLLLVCIKQCDDFCEYSKWMVFDSHFTSHINSPRCIWFGANEFGSAPKKLSTVFHMKFKHPNLFFQGRREGWASHLVPYQRDKFQIVWIFQSATPVHCLTFHQFDVRVKFVFIWSTLCERAIIIDAVCYCGKSQLNFAVCVYTLNVSQ